MSIERSDELMEIIKHHVEELRKHFDTVEIFCTIYDQESKETERANMGSGNWFARFGQVAYWLKQYTPLSRNVEP
jgi:hypothetical protein